MKTKKVNLGKQIAQKKSYSLRELTPEITGVAETSYYFNAAYKDLQRITLLFREPLGIKDSKLDLILENKDQYVYILKSFYNSPELKDTLKRINKGIEDKSEDNKDENYLDESIKDIDVVLDAFVESLSVNKSEEFKNELKDNINKMNSDEFYNKAEEIKKRFFKDISATDKINILEIKIELLIEYENIFDNALAEWRNKVRTAMLIQNEMEKINTDFIINNKKDKQN